MASITLPEFIAFNINTEPNSLGIEWNKWTSRFENLLTAFGVTEDKRKKGLLLYYSGKDVHDIYNTLDPIKTEVDSLADEMYEDVQRNLTNYHQRMRLRKFIIFIHSYNGKGESIDKYVARPKEAVSRCGFTEVHKEIKHQIVFGCCSRKVRRKARSGDPSLEDLVKFARAIEKLTVQAKLIENKEGSINRVG